MQNEVRIVNLDSIPGFPPQGDGIGDVKGKYIYQYLKKIVVPI